MFYSDSPFLLTQSCPNSDPSGVLTGQTLANYFLKSSGRQVVVKEENNLLRSTTTLSRNRVINPCPWGTEKISGYVGVEQKTMWWAHKYTQTISLGPSLCDSSFQVWFWRACSLSEKYCLVEGGDQSHTDCSHSRGSLH